MRIIPLTQGKVALVDDSDFESVAQFKWFANRTQTGYYAARQTRSGTRQKKQYLHRFLLPGILKIDQATTSQNARSFRQKRKGVSSRFRGVSWHKPSKKWFAKIEVNKKGLYLGVFNHEVDAARAYDGAAKKFFGEFACPNFSK